MSRVFAIALALPLAAGTARAQFEEPSPETDLLVDVSYQPAIGLGQTRDFVCCRPGWRGFGFDARWFVLPKLSLGASFAWSVFDERTRGVVSSGDLDVSGVQDRQLEILPANLQLGWWPSRRTAIQPWLALNAGGAFVEERVDVGLYTFASSGWHWALAPEAGILVPIGRSGTGLLLGLRYNHVFPAGDVARQQSLSLQLGFSFGRGWE